MKNINGNEHALSIIELVETVIPIIKKVGSYHEIIEGEDIIEYYKEYLTDYDLSYKLTAYFDEYGLTIKLSYNKNNNAFIECDEELTNQILDPFNINVQLIDNDVIVNYSEINLDEINNLYKKHL